MECHCKDVVRQAFISMSTEARELCIDSLVPRVSLGRLTPLSFHRDYVAANKPVIITDAMTEWPALSKWTPGYLRTTLGHKDVTVAVTPNGYADAVANGLFTLPEEKQMKFGEFLDILDGQVKRQGVYYIQKQNSNFTTDFRELADDAAPDVGWASQAFGKQPDAINFWMGEERAVTSMHKDHYENIYCVVSGCKTFTLLPPTDQPFIPYETFSVAEYKEHDDGTFQQRLKDDCEQVPWIAIDPLIPDLTKYPQYARARPVRVSVNAGEMLYLPSLWFHFVQQTHGCIAVNYWYDMEFDVKYSYFKMVETLTKFVEADCSKVT